MMNIPTKTATPANTSRNDVEEPEALLDVVLVLLGDLLAREHLDVSGTTFVMFAASCSCDTPVSATAEIESICPGSASSFCAVL